MFWSSSSAKTQFKSSLPTITCFQARLRVPSRWPRISRRARATFWMSREFRILESRLDQLLIPRSNTAARFTTERKDVITRPEQVNHRFWNRAWNQRRESTKCFSLIFFLVLLKRGKSGFGFNIVGGEAEIDPDWNDSPPGIFVSFGKSALFCAPGLWHKFLFQCSQEAQLTAPSRYKREIEFSRSTETTSNSPLIKKRRWFSAILAKLLSCLFNTR